MASATDGSVVVAWYERPFTAGPVALRPHLSMSLPLAPVTRKHTVLVKYGGKPPSRVNLTRKPMVL